MSPSPRKYFAIALLIVAPLAGCTSDTSDDDDVPPTTPPAPPTPPATPPAPPSQPAPDGTAISRADLQSLIAAFDDQPFQGGQGSPEHVSKWVSEDSFISLHVNNADPTQATELLWTVIGIKGVFCAEAQPGGADGGFTHFHKFESATWDAGHGGQARDEGYWLLHTAVTDIPNSMVPWGPVDPGTDYNFMPTPAPSCGSDVPEPDFSPPGADGLDAGEIAALNAAFDDQPFKGGQGSPEHRAKWVNEDAFIFLHWNNADPSKATALLWYGLGTRGQFCAAEQPSDDFTHFHQWTSASWDAGHGGKARDYGYWLQHNAVMPLPASSAGGPPWGPVAPGVDRDFMPTAASSC